MFTRKKINVKEDIHLYLWKGGKQDFLKANTTEPEKILDCSISFAIFHIYRTNIDFSCFDIAEITFFILPKDALTKLNFENLVQKDIIKDIFLLKN